MARSVAPTIVRGAGGIKLNVREWSLGVSWPAPEQFECGYLVEWKKQGEEYDRQSRAIETSGLGPYWATIHVEPGTSYTVRVSKLYSRIGGVDAVLGEVIGTTQQQQQSPPGKAAPPELPAREPDAQALTARVTKAPAEHRGTGKFAMRIAFSEPVAGRAGDAVATMQASGGSLSRAVRVDGRADLWTLILKPSSHEAVTVTLPATADCAAAGAICTADGRSLASPLVVTVPGPPGLSVADARAREGRADRIDFVVSLSRAAAHEVKVRYATRDGTATAGRITGPRAVGSRSRRERPARRFRCRCSTTPGTKRSRRSRWS